MYSKYMINTYSESSLHRTLKTIYAVKNNGVTEVTIKHKICDIFTESGDIIEIQTQHISALKAKLEALLNEYQITIIRPLVQEKYIETYDTAHKLIRRRKSPKKETLYSIYRELTGIHPFIGHHNLILEIPCITVCEIREEKNYPIQLKNKSRRFLHCWEKKDKKLEQIFKEPITIDNINRINDCFIRYLFSAEGSENIVLNFINSVMKNLDFETFVKVEILNPFSLSKYLKSKESIMDIRCVTESGQVVIIEIQLQGNNEFIYRSLFYWAKGYSVMLDRGENYNKLQALIIINILILDFKLIENIDDIHTCYVLKEIKHNNILTDHCQIHFRRRRAFALNFLSSIAIQI